MPHGSVRTVSEAVGIIGAGIVGLATARQLAQAGVPVTVWEKEPGVGRHQTGRNSGVVHAGIYYQPGSAKAKNCRRGVELLRAYCAERDLPWEYRDECCFWNLRSDCELHDFIRG